MSLVTELRKTLFGARAIAGQLGFRPHTVTLVNTTFSGDHPGDGLTDVIETALTESDGQPPKVRWLNDEERALANVGLGEGAVEVGPITPIGSSLAALTRPLENGEARQLRITGPKHPTGALYRITDIDQQKALRIMIRAHSVANQP